MRSLIITLFIIATCLSASARTWTVDKTGTGDFTVLQDALDAMASGDTIRMGPGRFDEWAIFNPGPNETMTRGFINVTDATIMGSPEGTIIGPADTWDLDDGQTIGFENTVQGSVLRLHGLTCEGLEWGVLHGVGDSLFVTECVFRENRNGMGAGTRYTSIARSEFHQPYRFGFGALSYHQDRMDYSDCSSIFEGPDPATHLQLEGTLHGFISGSSFEGGHTGIALSGGPDTEVTQCTFDTQSWAGIALSIGPTLQLSHSSFRGGRYALVGSSWPYATILVEDITVESVTHATLALRDSHSGHIHGSLLAAGIEGIVEDNLYPDNNKNTDPDIDDPVAFDMRHNWWGTTDPDSIAALITDFRDDERLHYIIKFEPFLSEPVAGERRSMGQLKSLFR